MDKEIVLEALSALTGFSVKPLPEGGVPNNGHSGGAIPNNLHSGGEISGVVRLLKALRTGDDQHTGHGLGLYGLTARNELTTENFISTVFDRQLQSQVLTPDGLTLSFKSPGTGLENSAASRSNDISAEEQLRTKLFVDMKKFFDPGYDYDFRSGSDSSKCSRGGEPYARPWGWYRFALKVQNKYPDGNAWLGSGGWRSQSSPGEWPVSFHGTSIGGAKAIAETHYEPGSGQVYGRGIYSSPEIHEAEQYTKKFKSKTDGKFYKVIMQNRINPEKREFTARKDYWLVPIPEKTSSEEAEKIVTQSIRPYGILIKQQC